MSVLKITPKYFTHSTGSKNLLTTDIEYDENL